MKSLLRFVACLCAFFSVNINASLINTYGSWSDFNNAYSYVVTEDFNSIPSGESFKINPLNIGDFSVVRNGLRTDNEAQFEVSPFNDSIAGRTTTVTGTDTVFTFINPIMAFAADLSAWNDYGTLRTTVEADGFNVPVSIESDSTTRFFGFSSSQPFTEVKFIGNDVGDGWFFDNLAYTPVPLPAGIYLFLSGLVGLVGAKLRGRNA